MKLTSENFYRENKTDSGQTFFDQSVEDSTRSKDEIGVVEFVTVALFIPYLINVVLFVSLSVSYGYWYLIPIGFLWPPLLNKIPSSIIAKSRKWSWCDYRLRVTTNDLIGDVLMCLFIAIITQSIVLGILYVIQTFLSAISISLMSGVKVYKFINREAPSEVEGIPSEA